MKLSDAIALLRKSGIDSPAHDAREIFRTLGKIPSPELLFPGCEAEDSLVKDAVRRRALREPLQYILGEVGFYRESYRVTPAVLIPREDTELLVDYAVSHLPKGARFLDLCTGSGCIAVSVLHNTENTSCIATDLSGDALKIAGENADRYDLGGRIRFLQADATQKIPDLSDGKFDAVLSNPPYVSDPAYRELAPEIAFEPKMAFVAGEDGGDFYRALIPLYRNRLSDGGFLAFEIGYDQADLLRDLSEKHGMSCEILRDFSNHPRVAVLKPIH